MVNKHIHTDLCNEPAHAKTYNKTCVTSNDPDQLVHPPIMARVLIITKTRLQNFDPLKPHFYTVKLEFTRVYIIFLNSAQKHRLWILVRTASSMRF